MRVGVYRSGWTPPGNSSASGCCRRRCAVLYRRARRTKNIGQAGGGDCVRRVCRRILIRAIAQGVLQVVVHSESRADHRLFIKRTPPQPDSRLRQKFRPVDCEQRVAHLRQANVGSRFGRAHDARTAERVVCGPPLRFVPARAEFIAETERHSQIRAYANHVLGVPGPEKRGPAQRCRRGVVQKAGRAGQEVRQSGKS